MDLHKKALQNASKQVPDEQDEDGDVQEELKDAYQPEVLKIPKTGKPIQPTVHMSDSGQGATKKLNDYSPISYKQFFQEIVFMDNGTPVYLSGSEPLIFFCLHGAGDSAASFALLAKQVKPFSSLVSFDFRGHGLSKIQKNKQDLSLETLLIDAQQVLDFVLAKRPTSNVVIIGHSMGGSVACQLTQKLMGIKEQNVYNERVHGLIVIDVVEGTAIEALPFMQTIVQNRPVEFSTQTQAIQWHIKSGTVRNLHSVRVSAPPQFIQVQQGTDVKYQWKVDLLASQKYWLDWFKGLTQSFLNLRLPKLLMVAEQERMDQELTIAQMQGKFQLVVLHGCGHYIQEDEPHGTAQNLHHFLHSFRIPLSTLENQLLKTVGVGKFVPKLVDYDQRGVF